MCRCGGYLWARPPKVAEKPVPVPLLAVHVEATLLDFCARVEIRQTFANQEDAPIEATYQFPLEEHNTVCELHAEIDGRKVTGVCKRKEDALNDYDDAIASGYGAYALEQDNEDMLKLAVGNLPPKAVVVVTVVYVTELKFHNGAGEWILRSNSRSQSNFFKTKVTYKIPDISIHVGFDMTTAIESVACPSHAIDYTAGEVPGEGSAKLVHLTASDRKQLDKDFVLMVKLAESNASLARLESDNNEKLCALVAVQPKLEWPENERPNSEVVVIVDRSASMAGKRIAQVRDSLQLVLRSLPEGVLFNIAGFGSKVDLLFKNGSVEYTLESFQRATKYVAEMKANLGGTDVLKVLEKVAKDSPKPGQLRQILFLTDGEVFNTSECVAFVLQQARHTRVFTFGIGSDASEELVRGLATAGNGFAEFVTADQPLMDAKIMRQLERVLQPALTDLQLDWGSVPVEQVTPAQLKPLFSGECLTIYAFLEDGGNKDEALDYEVTLRGTLGAQNWETKVKLPRKALKGATLHALAAKQLISELEVADDLIDREEAIVALSETYSVLSRYTTFIAVEERDEATEGTMQLRQVVATSVARPDDEIGGPELDAAVMPPPIPEILQADLMTNAFAFQCKSKKKGGLGLPRLGLPSWAARASVASPQHQAPRSLHHTAYDSLIPSSSSASMLAPIALDRAESLSPGKAAATEQKREEKEKRKVRGQLMKALEDEVISKRLDSRKRCLDQDSMKNKSSDDGAIQASVAVGGGGGTAASSAKGKEKKRDEQKDEDEEGAEDDKQPKIRGRRASDAKSGGSLEGEVTRADSLLPGPPPAEMKALVLAQRYDGSWRADELLQLLAPALSEKEFKSALARALPDAGTKKRSKSGGKSPRGAVETAPADIWATAIALAVLRTRFDAQKHNWNLLAQKREVKKGGSASADALLAEATQFVAKPAKI